MLVLNTSWKSQHNLKKSFGTNFWVDFVRVQFWIQDESKNACKMIMAFNNWFLTRNKKDPQNLSKLFYQSVWIHFNHCLSVSGRYLSSFLSEISFHLVWNMIFHNLEFYNRFTNQINGWIFKHILRRRQDCCNGSNLQQQEFLINIPL